MRVLKILGIVARPAAQSLSHLPKAVHRPYSSASSHRSTLTKILQNVGSKREIQQYLSLFSSVDSHKFAVIKVGGAILTDHLEELVASLSSLYTVGLFPVVVHGGGPQLNKKLKEAGIEERWDSGIRITDGRTLAIARNEFLDQNLRLTEALFQADIRAQPITQGVFLADFLDQERYEMVGKIKHINTKPVESAIKSGCLPVLSSMAMTEEGRTLNVNADVAAAELARALKPLKIIYLSEKGGMLHGGTGKRISTIDLNTEFKGLTEQPWMKHGNLLKLKQFKDLLDELPSTSSVAMIEPKDLTKELFTDSGAGTLISRGNTMLSTSDYHDIQNLQILQKTLTDTPNLVGKGVKVEEYFPWLAEQEYRIYYNEPMTAVAIVLTSTKSSPKAQLTVFSVTDYGWLTNAAERLFSSVTKDNPDLMWAIDGKDPDIYQWFTSRRPEGGTFTRKDDVLFWTGDHKSAQYRSMDIMPAWQEQGRALFSTPQVRHYSTSRLIRTSIPRDPYSTSRCLGTYPRTGGVATCSTSQYPMTYTTYRGCRTYTSTTKSSRIALIGARGYTGQALIELLDKHPHMELKHVSSRELAGQKLKGYTKEEITYEDLTADDMRRMEERGEIDCWVMALPNGVCKPFVDAINEVGNSKTVIVDLSADYRFDPTWTYGLPELVDRSKIKSATRISNPGCYATAAQIGIAPVLKYLGSQHPTVFGVSGYSGAGTKPSPKNDINSLRDNLIPYSLTDHVHEREISSQLGTSVAFIPHVAAWFQGIHHTISLPLNTKLSSREVRNIYQERYAGEPLIKVTGEAPQVKSISKNHGIGVGGFGVHSSGERVVVCVTIDNLLKGAATQALQNCNLALGHSEFLGIPIS